MAPGENEFDTPDVDAFLNLCVWKDFLYIKKETIKEKIDGLDSEN